MKIGAHCVLFREKIASETAEVLSAIEKAGFAGFEMGMRFFAMEDGNKIFDAVKRSNIELFGLHVGTSFPEFVENKEAVTERLLNAAKFLEDMPNKNIIMSSAKFDECDNVKAAKSLNDIAKSCAEKAVKIHYHNHAGEFENNMEVFKIMWENAPVLNYGLDLGWAYVGGGEPLDIVKQYGSRISYVHLRDAKSRSREGFVDLGEGVIDFPALMGALQELLGNDGWALVEYEDGPQDIQRYVKARKFLKGLGY